MEKSFQRVSLRRILRAVKNVSSSASKKNTFNCRSIGFFCWVRILVACFRAERGNKLSTFIFYSFVSFFYQVARLSH